ncbi:hypothetical protein OG711_38675 (plasmid) [Streptomyces uncialis]|uniref:hypothetical protein n=1 Tax=Streptomyces uncialis TaxID=1048205 RepID=UPI002E357C47|nr:hypothetical protein [Streptomyces uncialis]
MNRKERLARADELLRGAEVLQDAFADLDSDALLERIARRAARRRPSGEPGRGGGHRAPAVEPGAVSPRPRCSPAGAFPLYRRAAARLEALSVTVVTGPDTVAALARFDNAPRIEPAGALTFACLLYLSDRPEGAQFWWQFAAGAGVATAAYCLYLHHTQCSEEEMARFWFDQAHRLHHHTGAGLYPRIDIVPPTPLAGGHCPQRSLVATVAGGAPAEPDKEITDPSLGSGHFLSWAMEHMELAYAVLRLDIDHDDDYGPVPRPDPALAAELEEHLEHSH